MPKHDWSKYRPLSPHEAATLRKKAGAKTQAPKRSGLKAHATREAEPKPPSKPRFAMVPENLFPHLAGLGGPAILLLMVMLMLSGRRHVRLSEGWLSLSKAILQSVA